MPLRLVEKGAEPLRGLVAIAGPSNSGKTFSALRVAAGLQEILKGRTALLDTELRGNLYEHRFDFDRYVMDPPFSPQEWLAAFRELDGQYSVVISDNFSDEHEGMGGLCEMAENSGLKNDVAKWAFPKAQHKALMGKIRLLKSQHIFILRAADKIKIVDGEDRNGNKKKIVEAVGWTPVAEKNFIYDVTLGWMLPPASGGHANVWKSIDGFDFQDGEQLSEEHGRIIGRWITGQAAPMKAAGKAETIMLDMVTIVTDDGEPKCTTTILREALEAFAAVKKMANVEGKAVVANLPALRILASYATGKTKDRLDDAIKYGENYVDYSDVGGAQP